jgi:hypothetical protein
MSLFSKTDWQETVERVGEQHPNWSLKQRLKYAKKIYKKSKGGVK